MSFTGGDHVWAIYQGPPREYGDKLINGDRFFLGGHRQFQAREGVELARGMSGLLRELSDYRYDTSSEQPGSTFVGSIPNKREINASINVFGDTPAEFRANLRRWQDNHPEDSEGRLWFLTSDGEPRYLPVRPSPSAGLSSIETDPTIMRKLEGMEWGWTSDEPYFLGYISRQDFVDGSVTFYNPSTAKVVYPKVYLPGPGKYTVGEITTPVLTANEMVRIDYNPLHETYVKLNLTTGAVQNLWYTLEGKRPKLGLKPQTKNTISLTYTGTGTSMAPYVEFTPKFRSYI